MSSSNEFLPFLEQSLQTQDLVVSPLAGDASTRKYFRVARDSSSGHQSWVLMSWEPFEASSYPFLSVLNHFAQFAVQVPKVISISENEGLILLEDLGDLTLERKFWENSNENNIFPFYKLAIDELIKINFLASKTKTVCTAFDAEFDHAKLFWELENAFEHLFIKMLNYPMSPELESACRRELSQIAALLADEPKHISHRDYHSRNLMVRLNRLFVIDFQDARLGSITYDLSSLLKDPYVSLSPAMEHRLIDYYLNSAREHLPSSFSREKFNAVYDRQAFQRCFKAIGTFTSMYNKKSDRRYLKNILPALKRIEEVLPAIPELSNFQSLLEMSGAHDHRYEKL